MNAEIQLSYAHAFGTPLNQTDALRVPTCGAGRGGAGNATCARVRATLGVTSRWLRAGSAQSACRRVGAWSGFVICMLTLGWLITPHKTYMLIHVWCTDDWRSTGQRRVSWLWCSAGWTHARGCLGGGGGVTTGVRAGTSDHRVT
jgi:hypothetical protein